MKAQKLPPIPIPAPLLERLADYPEAIAEVRDTLDRYLKKPSYSQPLDQALWALEDTLSDFIYRAQDEVVSAKAAGDPKAVTKAQEKLSVMFSARSPNDGMRETGPIVDYFKKYEGAF